MTTESLLVLTPITMPQDYDLSRIAVSWFLSLTALIVFPITYFIGEICKTHPERKIIAVLLSLCAISCLVLINTPFYDKNLIRFIIFYSILFISCNLLESVDSALLAKIFPANLHLGICNSGFTIIISQTGGRFLGSLLITVFGLFSNEEVVYDVLIIFYLALYAVLLLLIYRHYTELRVKAIARIIQKKEIG